MDNFILRITRQVYEEEGAYSIYMNSIETNFPIEEMSEKFSLLPIKTKKQLIIEFMNTFPDKAIAEGVAGAVVVETLDDETIKTLLPLISNETI